MSHCQLQASGGRVIRVLIADDHPVLRRGLKSSLEETPDIRVTDEAEDGPTTIQKVQSGGFDVLLLDISMPGMSGIEVLRRVHHDDPSVKVLVLSTYPEQSYAVRCLRAGARAYLTKNSDPSELASAIRVVAEGKRYVSATLAEQLAEELGAEIAPIPHLTLSERETQVFRMIGRGLTVSGIAEELSLSVATVNTYRARILEKMGMENNAQIIHYILNHHLLDNG
jgi:DNA-binding NarL/FixJ family response regulator